MNPAKLTTKAQQALQAMQQLAREKNHQVLEPSHLLSALLNQPEGIVPSTLQHMNIALPPLKRELEAVLPGHDHIHEDEVGPLHVDHLLDAHRIMGRN